MKGFYFFLNIALISTVIFIGDSYGQNSPGNVSNAKAWFKVDNYTNGSKTWTNSVTNDGMKILTANNAPTFEEASPLWNYNTSLSFGGTSANQGFRAEVTNLPDLLEPNKGTIIAIASYTGAGSTDRGVCGYRSTNLYNNELSILYNETWFKGHLYTYGVPLNWTSPIGKTPSIRTLSFLRSDNNAFKTVTLKSFNNSVLDKTNINSNVTLDAGYLRETGTKTFSIGEIHDVHKYKGSIAEVIVFAKAITPEERLRTESYLAIKYGITLGTPANPASYTSSNSQNVQNIWKGDAEYQKNIMGIGRDDLSELLQKQSHQRDDSVRIYLGDLKTTNKLNQSTFSKDRSYVVMGSNDMKLNATDASILEMEDGIANSPCGLYSIIERKWKVQRTNMPDVFNIDIKLSAAAMLSHIDPMDLRLIVDSDDKLGNGWQGCYANGDNGLVISYANGIVSIKGISTDHIPDNQIRYITLGSAKNATPLPVGLSSFEAQCEGTDVELLWKTESETNNDYFTIEKSRDGENFQVLSLISGCGNKSTPTLYSYSDYTNHIGISYYRLSQTDFDGKETVLKTISTNCEGELDIMIYPNPTKDGVYLTLNGKSDSEIEVMVYSLTGLEVARHIINGSTWIELPEEKGVYLIKYCLEKEMRVEKIVKY